MRIPLRQRLGREIVRSVLAPLLHWGAAPPSRSGYTVILGVPWDLRHLLPVNLRFISRLDLSGLRRLIIVFDRRRRPGIEGLLSAVRAEFPQLPVTVLFYPGTAGAIVEKVNVSTFFNSLNTVLGIARCETKHAILHDFDLYPLEKNYFASVHEAMVSRRLRFCGSEYTDFEGLKASERILGTWCLGIDVDWLRRHYRPIDCFHRVATVNGRLVNLDPYSWIQSRTPERALVGTLDESSFCHVKNLCSTYLRFVTGRWAKIVWRLHYVWYLEKLVGKEDNFVAAIEAMRAAQSSLLTVNSYAVDFKGTDPTCAGVLEAELHKMEQFLFGEVRPEVVDYTDAFSAFLNDRVGAPSVVASPAVTGDPRRGPMV